MNNPFRKNKKSEGRPPEVKSIQTAAPKRELELFGRFPKTAANLELYASLRRSVPIIGASIGKLNRLLGGFEVKTGSESLDAVIREFLKNVPVGAQRRGIDAFVSTHFTDLLTFGTAVGEIVLGEDGIACLYNAPLRDVSLSFGEDPTALVISSRDERGNFVPVRAPSLVIVSVLDPEPGELFGKSILEGLPFVTEILEKIFSAIGSNWERVGNVRYCVTYRPQNDSTDRAFAQSRAALIADEWKKTMSEGGKPKDFVAVGDVRISAIGADNQILDSEIPVRQMLEQIVAKLGLPPFLLGLSWSSTERMSSQQADILTSELEAYRRLLTPALSKIVEVFLALRGEEMSFEIVWDDITLQDIVSLAESELKRAKAEEIRGRGIRQ